MDIDDYIDAIRVEGGRAGHAVTYRCPVCGLAARCDTSASLTVRHTGQQAFLVQCQDPRCEAPALVITTPRHAPQGVVWDGSAVYPEPSPSYAPDGVPKELACDFEEALRAQQSGLNLSAALVGRRVLQAAARARVEIEALIIPNDLKKAANHVRLIGNEAAHNDPVLKEEVEELLAFTAQVLEQLFIVPHRVAKLTASRAARGAKVPKDTK